MIFYSPELDEIILFTGTNNSGTDTKYNFLGILDVVNVDSFLFDRDWIYIGNL